MKKIGDIELRLAKGPIPHYKELKELERSIIKYMIYEFGTKEIINRFSNPLWFNSFACLLGFEWNYSGMTTVTLQALKEITKEDNLPLIVLGGKGKRSKITEEVEMKDIKDKLKDKIKDLSITSAKIDNNLIQDGYNLYFHFLIADENNNTTVINQKMSIKEQKVRRFHWINIEYFNDNQIGFGYNNKTLNLADRKSEDLRKEIVELLNNDKEVIKNYIIRLKNQNNTILKYFNNDNKYIFYQELPYYLKIPDKIYYKALDIKESINNFKDIFFIKGLGPGLLRALAYTAKILYGSELSWKDPIIYTFAHGTKVGKPFYVQKKIMLEEAEFIKNAIEEAKVKKYFKIEAIKRLNNLIDI
ncbi:hypothetical protein MJ1_0539 [Nanobdella aerobiophila]|uniref:DUF763 domain-containing protein n=1 Tax=Nanobdella aerobiophila TaxID=2586965 RepID=A0A915SIJ8_9ARCH|nr:DUF763 domain-containing protein [Nanobdella aerobiophila]BBL45692.1 hypothetical protein MJ1_0539 [Nanobdella aerobiophila]